MHNDELTIGPYIIVNVGLEDLVEVVGSINLPHHLACVSKVKI